MSVSGFIRDFCKGGNKDWLTRTLSAVTVRGRRVPRHLQYEEDTEG